MWKHHVFYELRPFSVIVNFGGHIYRVLEVVLAIVVSLIPTKQFHEVISQMDNFVLFMVWLKGEWKVIATTTTLEQGLST
jgi:hypothetical protein